MGDRLCNWFFILLGVITVGLFALCGWGCSTHLITGEYDLLQLTVDSGVDGNFFLGCGSVDSEAVFYFYTQNEKGMITLWSEPAETVNIYQTGELKAVSRMGIEGYWDIFIPPNSILNYYNPNMGHEQ